MNNATLPAFSLAEFQKAHLFLATRVSEMMGRKLEENDWAQVYCAAKEIPQSGWSNTDIDVMHGNLGVEQKSICRKSTQPIKDSCGTIIMHPAGTRAIRIPEEKDATLAARDILRQYGDIITRRHHIVDVVNRFNNNEFSRTEAVAELQRRVPLFSRTSADKRIPSSATGLAETSQPPDLRIGWLLWQNGLREFLYFEEPMLAPDPGKYIARWNDRSGSGSRIGSRNLWIYNEQTGEKEFSVTTEAGPKVQPYFRVPGPNDPNLYHFVSQGERVSDGLVRVWLTESTARTLRVLLGALDPTTIATAIDAVQIEERIQNASGHVFGTLAVEVLLPLNSYEKLKSLYEGVSDEHNFKQLLDFIIATNNA